MTRNARGLVLAVSTLLCFFPKAALAWGETGHRIVAAIAWKTMSAEVRKKVIALLATAPANSEIRLLRPAIGPDRDELWFIAVATWPDLIRARERTSHSFHHTEWHFADHFWQMVNGQPQDVRGPASTNAVERLTSLQRDLAKHATTGLPDAVKVAWILHLVADVHQPLHNSSRITAKLARGDTGGNAIHLTERLNLHGYWDRIPDELFESDRTVQMSFSQKQAFERTPRYIQDWSAKIMRTFPPSIVSSGDSATAFDAWSRAGLQVAELVAYDGVQDGQMPTSVYRAKAGEAAQRAIAMAGYRLGALLTRLFA